jgi:hypothetical protein
MANPFTITSMAVVSIAGAALGVYLGHGAVAEINPAYFSSPPEGRFFSDLVPGGYRVAASRTDGSWANDVNISGRPECFDCANFIDEQVASAELPAEQTDPVYIEDAPGPDAYRPSVDIERYASFPVTEEEARQPRSASMQSYAASRDDSGQPNGEEENAPINM